MCGCFVTNERPIPKMSVFSYKRRGPALTWAALDPVTRDKGRSGLGCIVRSSELCGLTQLTQTVNT